MGVFLSPVSEPVRIICVVGVICNHEWKHGYVNHRNGNAILTKFASWWVIILTTCGVVHWWKFRQNDKRCVEGARTQNSLALTANTYVSLLIVLLLCIMFFILFTVFSFFIPFNFYYCCLTVCMSNYENDADDTAFLNIYFHGYE